MLFHRSAGTFLIFVEEEHTLGQLTVVESLWLQHIVCHCLVVACSDEFVNAFALILLAHFVQRVEESEVMDLAEVFLLEVLRRYIIICVNKGEHVFEHTAGSTGSGHELDNLFAACLIVFPCLGVCADFFLGRGDDAFSYGGGSIQL